MTAVTLAALEHERDDNVGVHSRPFGSLRKGKTDWPTNECAVALVGSAAGIHVASHSCVEEEIITTVGLDYSSRVIKNGSMTNYVR